MSEAFDEAIEGLEELHELHRCVARDDVNCPECKVFDTAVKTLKAEYAKQAEEIERLTWINETNQTVLDNLHKENAALRQQLEAKDSA